MQDNLLFFDTETTGFVQTRRPASDSTQPHMVQLAAQLVSPNQEILSGFSVIVSLPEGVEVPDRAAQVHGISTEKANKYGVTKATALRLFRHLLNRAGVIVAHNKGFDVKMILSEAHRVLPELNFQGKQEFCTMEAASPIVNLPPTEKMIAAGFNKPKSPRLEECISHFFNEDLEGAHDAMIDVVACQRVYFHLKSMEQADATSS